MINYKSKIIIFIQYRISADLPYNLQQKLDE